MKKPLQGPSLYYASDKNIFDALNQHRVDTKTLHKLFERRNILISHKTPREELASHFSRLTHDLEDHRDISARLGVAGRRERITSIDLKGEIEKDQITAAVEKLRKNLLDDGDVVHVSRNGDFVSVTVQYSTIDYKRSEFTQVQKRDGVLEIVKKGSDYVIRNTQNEYMNQVRETFITELNKDRKEKVESVYISLFDVPEPQLRSKFFYELMNSIPNYVRQDVKDVYVFKAKPEEVDDSENDDGHVERVFLRGSRVSQTKLLSNLLGEEKYYIVKVGWVMAEVTKLSQGQAYEVEALFDEPRDCTGFSFLLKGVYPVEEGQLSTKRRAPTKGEIDQISQAIEARARALAAEIRQEAANVVLNLK